MHPDAAKKFEKHIKGKNFSLKILIPSNDKDKFKIKQDPYILEIKSYRLHIDMFDENQYFFNISPKKMSVLVLKILTKKL